VGILVHIFYLVEARSSVFTYLACERKGIVKMGSARGREKEGENSALE
jgi:hypothetical protein